MKMFMIEWWDAKQEKYHQEYYLQTKMAFQRFLMLEQDVRDSNPEITTQYLDNSTGDGF